MLAQMTQSRPTTVSMIWLPAPMRVPEPMRVVPRKDHVRLDRHVFRQLDRSVYAHAARVDIVTPDIMWPSLMAIRSSNSASASCARSLMPLRVPSSSTTRETTGRRSSRASSTSAGR